MDSGTKNAGLPAIRYTQDIIPLLEANVKKIPSFFGGVF